MYRLDLTVKQFNLLVDTIKKCKRMGSSFIIYGDTIQIMNLVPKLIGRHYVQNIMIPNLTRPYICDDISIIVDQFNTIKGRKSELYLTITDYEVSITINDIHITICSAYDSDKVDMAVTYSSLSDPHDWIGISKTILEKLRLNECITICSNSNDQVRVAKSLFQECGTSKSIGYSMNYRFDTIDEELKILYMETIFEGIRVLHKFPFIKYQEQN